MVKLTPAPPDIETPFIYWPMVESSLGIIGACLPLMRPLVAGAASPGFMRKLRTVHSDTDEGSITLWDQSQMAKSTAGWGSTFSTFQFGSTSTASTKLGSISGPFAQYNGSAATQDRLECVSPKHLDPAELVMTANLRFEVEVANMSSIEQCCLCYTKNSSSCQITPSG